MLKSAGVPKRPWTNTSASMPDSLSQHVESYIGALRRENASVHTLRNYQSDLDQWVAYFTTPEGAPPPLEDLDVLALREWLGTLYRQELSPVTIRRKLAAVRSLYAHLMREGVVKTNIAK